MNDKVITLSGLKHYNDIVKAALRNKASTSDIPTKTSQLQNDSGFITSSSIPTKLSQFDNDTNFITIEDVPENIYATNAEIDNLF